MVQGTEWRHAFLGFVNLKQILLDPPDDLKPLVDRRGYPALVYTSPHEGDVADIDRLLEAFRDSDSKPIRILLRF